MKKENFVVLLFLLNCHRFYSQEQQFFSKLSSNQTNEIFDSMVNFVANGCNIRAKLFVVSATNQPPNARSSSEDGC